MVIKGSRNLGNSKVRFWKELHKRSGSQDDNKDDNKRATQTNFRFCILLWDPKFVRESFYESTTKLSQEADMCRLEISCSNG